MKSKKCSKQKRTLKEAIRCFVCRPFIIMNTTTPTPTPSSPAAAVATKQYKQTILYHYAKGPVYNVVNHFSLNVCFDNQCKYTTGKHLHYHIHIDVCTSCKHNKQCTQRHNAIYRINLKESMQFTLQYLHDDTTH